MTILLAAGGEPAAQAQWLQLMREMLPRETIVVSADGADRQSIDVAIVGNPPAEALSGLPALRLIQSLWAGVDGLLRHAGAPLGVMLARMVDPAMTTAMSETALWAVIGVQRDFFRYAQQQRVHRWLVHPQARADDTQVAVLGLGALGTAVALRLAAHGYAVRGWATRKRLLPAVETFAGTEALPAVLRGARIVVNLLPLTPATSGLLDARMWSLMAPGAAVVNLARGAHLVEADLLAALDSGRLSHAILDVFDREPLPAGHPFWDHPGVTLLPHVAAQTDPRSAALIAAANVKRLRAGEPVEHRVDAERGY